MTIGAFFEVLTAFLKFPGEVTTLIRMLSKTPEEKHQALLATVKDRFDELKTGGRPS